MTFLQRLGIELPIIQAPMAGVSTPAMAAAVSAARALGSIGVGATDAAGARAMIVAVRARCDRPLNVNVFCHQPPRSDVRRDASWLAQLRPHFESVGAQPPEKLSEIYRTFLDDHAMLKMLLEEKPRVVSFHFGIPAAERVRALRDASIMLIASVTSLAEGLAAAAAGMDAVVAQGYEAGGHRGMFDPDAADDRLGTLPLTRLLVQRLQIPVIASGGIMDGAGVDAALKLGAVAAQLGTAFIACPESAADTGYRAALMSDAAHHTIMTRAISGRPARCLSNRFTALGVDIADKDIPAYPIAYDAGKALNAAGRAAGDFGYGAQWAGQGAPLARSLPAGDLVRVLADEMR
jgi:nitronate monooxygenase